MVELLTLSSGLNWLLWQTPICKSERLEILSNPLEQGVLQKSVVEPIFFIDDLPLNGTNSEVDIYDDDATLTFSSRWNTNKSLMELYINEDLEYVVKWIKWVSAKPKENLC